MMSEKSIYFEQKVCGNSYDQKSQQNRNFDRKLEPKFVYFSLVLMECEETKNKYSAPRLYLLVCMSCIYLLVA